MCPKAHKESAKRRQAMSVRGSVSASPAECDQALGLGMWVRSAVGPLGGERWGSVCVRLPRFDSGSTRHSQ